jgi:hypothetical protein
MNNKNKTNKLNKIKRISKNKKNKANKRESHQVSSRCGSEPWRWHPPVDCHAVRAASSLPGVSS